MRLRLMAAAVLASACVTTTWRYQRIEGEVASIHPDLWYEIECTGKEPLRGDGGCAAALAPAVSCETRPELCAQLPGGGTSVACTGLEPLLSFVQLSDVKLREHAVLVTDESSTGLPKALDQQYRNDDAVLLATVLGINQLGSSGAPLGTCPALSAPQFVIHTGNSVELGLFSELTQFIGGMNELVIPWFNVVGPNDVAFLGARPNERVSGANAVVPFAPIADVDRFMRFHSQKGAKKDVSLPNPDQRTADKGPNKTGCRLQPNGLCNPDPRYPRSLFHGFDVNCVKAGKGLTQLEADLDTLCSTARGYYAFTVPSPRPEISFRVVVLNSAESVLDDGASGGREGRMLQEQLRWLQRELDALPSGTFALVFGHHPLSGLGDSVREPLTDLLSGRPRVLGYFHGGEGDSFRLHARDAGVGLAEVGTGALLDFPQLGREVEVLRAADGSLSVRVASFSQGPASRALPDPAPLQPLGGNCERLNDGTSFCRKLSYRAGRGFEASRQLSADAGLSPENANGLFLAWTPEGAAR
ncbi:MAG: hypothetical protein Q8N23_17860 [Archangium sp.]|nr:hypothetical protein [Archangium sp.]MDP3569412.1 hypothetical protein [Archangium sp.]